MHGDATHTRKRRRAASDPHWNGRPRFPLAPIPELILPPPNLEHDTEFWFEDGSIVLIAHNVGFRVYKRLLSEHSPFFRDLFQIPQPPGAPKIDGCPFVYLTDLPWQLRHLLRALFPTKGNLTFGRRQDTLDMDAVSAVILLAHKYQIDQLLAQSLSHLLEYYTDDFDEWIKPARNTCLRPTHIDAISAINLAHLTKTHSILPLALLDASMAGSLVLRGCMRGGCVAEGLAFPDLQCVIDGRAAVLEHCSRALARIFAPETAVTCTDSRRCTRSFAHKARVLEDMLEILYREGMARAWAEEFRNDLGSGWLICEECRTMVKRKDLEERREFWDALPGLFKLEIEGWGK
ncbi:hypothetical protein C8Q80DRAFT_1188200 [Daedaleopsis nitida]|nr:hypothetical protein C8Q80DRAFT_1188200 [Daedaleopsis nitida]